MEKVVVPPEREKQPTVVSVSIRTLQIKFIRNCNRSNITNVSSLVIRVMRL